MRVPESVLLSTLICFALTILLAASMRVSIREFDVPTPQSRPHDPAVAPDGSLWYTGQAANKLGRLDPASGKFKEFPLKTPGSGPHGLIADAQGNIWFTAISKGYIGKLNPQTGDITEYHLPDGADDPHTPVFDHQGILWFTTEESNAVGRLDPKTGQIDGKIAGFEALFGRRIPPAVQRLKQICMFRAPLQPCFIERDLQQPTFELVRLGKLVEVQDCFQHRLLRCLCRIGMIAQDSVCGYENRTFVRTNQLMKELTLAGTNTAY